MITDKTHSDKHDGNGNVMSCYLEKIKQVSRARQGNKLSMQETPNSVARSLTTGYRTRFGSDFWEEKKYCAGSFCKTICTSGLYETATQDLRQTSAPFMSPRVQDLCEKSLGKLSQKYIPARALPKKIIKSFFTPSRDALYMGSTGKIPIHLSTGSLGGISFKISVNFFL